MIPGFGVVLGVGLKLFNFAKQGRKHILEKLPAQGQAQRKWTWIRSGTRGQAGSKVVGWCSARGSELPPLPRVGFDGGWEYSLSCMAVVVWP